MSLEEHGDGRWRTSQLLPDEEITVTVEADGYETKSETLSLPEGEHTLQLLLADYAHVPHEPPVMSEVITITVAADASPQSDN